MAKFNLADVLVPGKVSNLDTAETKEISIELIDPNPNNFFTVEEDVTDLCESIKLNGLLQPPVVTPSEGGRYRLIAGHRRHKALKALAQELPEQYKTVTCRIVRPASPELEELMLIQTNTEAREIGWREKDEAATRTEKILIALQKQGVELPGKMRSHVAKIIKASESQIARAKFIAKNLINPLKKTSSIPDSTAYCLAHLPAEQQQELYEHYNKRGLYCLDGNAIKSYQENLAAGRDPFYVPPSAPRSCYEQKAKGGKYPDCTHEDVIAQRKKKRLPSWQKCGYHTCCSCCEYRFDCPDLCPSAKPDVDKQKKSDTYRIGLAFRAAREQKGLTVEAAADELQIPATQVLQYESTQTHTAGSITRLCELYGITPNEILGFAPASPTVTPPTTAGWIPANQAADLPDGYYTLLYEYDQRIEGQGGLPLLNQRTALRQNGRWFSLLGKQSLLFGLQKEKLVAVAPTFAAPEGYTFFLAGVDDPSVDDLADEDALNE